MARVAKDVMITRWLEQGLSKEEIAAKFQTMYAAQGPEFAAKRFRIYWHLATGESRRVTHTAAEKPVRKPAEPRSTVRTSESLASNDKLRTFIVDNHHTVMSYHQRYYNYTTCLAKTPYDRLRIVFLNSLEAARGGMVPLDSKDRCYTHFLKKIEKLRTNHNLSFKRFAECFIKDKEFNSPEQINDLSQILIDDNELPHFSTKKGNLFIKDLILVAGKQLFYDVKEETYLSYLIVPIEAVIRKVYITLYKLQLPKNNVEIYDDDIHLFSKQLFPEKPIYLDDLWLWGHFTFNKNTLPSTLNKAMLHTDRIIDDEFIEEHDLIVKLNTFIKIIHEATMCIKGA